MYQPQYTVPLTFLPSFLLFSPIASIPETDAESEEGTEEKLRKIFGFIHPSVPLHSTKNLFLNNLQIILQFLN